VSEGNVILLLGELALRSESDSTRQDLIAIRTFTSESEADIARGALEAFGIDCMLSHDDCDAPQAEEALTRGEQAD